MPVRRALSSLVIRAVEGRVRTWIDQEAQQREAALRDLTARVATLEEQSAKLEKRLSMSMGAIQASTTQLMQVKEQVAAAGNSAQQAMQRATSAHHTAEAAADGVTGVEEQIASLMEHLGTADRAPEPADDDGEAGAPKVCSIEGCGNKIRAKGYCAKHYQQWKRGTLEEATA